MSQPEEDSNAKEKSLDVDGLGVTRTMDGDTSSEEPGLQSDLVGEEFLLLGSNDVQPVIDKIVAAKPDVILNCVNGDTNLAFFRALRAAGTTPESVPTISFSIGEAELSRLEVSAMTGDYAAWNYFQSIESPANVKFVSAFHKKYGEEHAVTDPMEAAWVGVKLWAQAVKDAGTIDASVIRRAMRNQRMQAPGGEVRIDPATQHTFKTRRTGQVQSNGHFDIVWTGAKPEPPMPYPATRTTEEWRALLRPLQRLGQPVVSTTECGLAANEHIGNPFDRSGRS